MKGPRAKTWDKTFQIWLQWSIFFSVGLRKIIVTLRGFVQKLEEWIYLKWYVYWVKLDTKYDIRQGYFIVKAYFKYRSFQLI